MPMKTLNDLFVDELKDLYSAEHQLIKALPKLAKAADNAQLSQAFTMHLAETEEHAHRIEEIFAAGLEGTPRGKKCVAMEGLVAEGKEVMEDGGAADVVDAALIGAAQRVEHYEMAGYGTARAHAQQLGYANAARLLEQTLKEESAANEKLSQIAEASVNVSATGEIPHLLFCESNLVPLSGTGTLLGGTVITDGGTG
jgi:ferritin-like metal-binding protein YciE